MGKLCSPHLLWCSGGQAGNWSSTPAQEKQAALVSQARKLMFHPCWPEGGCVSISPSEWCRGVQQQLNCHSHPAADLTEPCEAGLGILGFTLLTAQGTASGVTKILPHSSSGKWKEVWEAPWQAPLPSSNISGQGIEYICSTGYCHTSTSACLLIKEDNRIHSLTK